MLQFCYGDVAVHFQFNSTIHLWAINVVSMNIMIVMIMVMIIVIIFI